MKLPLKSVFFTLTIAALVAGACSSSDTDNSAPTDTRDTERPQEQTISSPQIQISAGGLYSCAALQNGTVWCWNNNTFPGLISNDTETDSLVSDQVSGIITATQVSVGGTHSCATLQDGTVRCWGFNATGELGDGTRTYGLVPVQVLAITTATQVSAGAFHSCATLQNGTVWCWGWNVSGQLGDGTRADSPVPVQVSGITTATQVSTGGTHSCATLQNGTVWCWGWNENGQLGNGTTTDSLVPVQVSGITTATQVSAGGNFSGNGYSCAALQNGTVWCWGPNGDGQLGDGTTTDSLVPVQVSGITTATQVSAGGNFFGGSHSCATLQDATVWCWGENGGGQLGDGTTTNSSVPVQVSGITTATQVSVGGTHSCATLRNRTVWCWGVNNDGELGDDATIDSLLLVQVSGIPAEI